MPKDYQKIYSDSKLYWDSNPSEIVEKFAGQAPVGKALDLGMGEGYNVLYLAEQGFDVTGVESVESGVEKCRQLAEEKDLPVKLVNADVYDFKIAVRKYSLILAVNLFQFVSKTDAADLITDIIDGLKKGGVFICQTFTYDDPSYKVRKKKSKEIEPGVFVDGTGNIYSLYDYGELLSMTSQLRLIYYREYDYYDTKRGTPHWHGVVELVAKKI